MNRLAKGKLTDCEIIFISLTAEQRSGIPTLLYLTMGAETLRNLSWLLAASKILRGLDDSCR